MAAVDLSATDYVDFLQFVDPAAGDEMSRGYFLLMLCLMAGILYVRAARGKTAARLRIDRGGQLALQQDTLLLVIHIRDRNSGKQGFGIGMGGISEQFHCRALLFPAVLPWASYLIPIASCH